MLTEGERNPANSETDFIRPDNLFSLLMFTAKEILVQLDKCCDDFTFPMMDNGYVYLAGSKLSAYRDDNRWVLIIEIIGFSYRGGGHNGITNCLHVYGNCLDYEPGTRNENFLYLTGDADDGNTFDEEQEFFLNPEATHFLFQNEKTAIVHDRDAYTKAGIILKDEEKINAFEFLRLLDYTHHDKLVATDEEIIERIPPGIPMILALHEWFHPDCVSGELTSQNETFQMIASVLETGNPAVYQPKHASNTHWGNWPDSGTL